MKNAHRLQFGYAQDFRSAIDKIKNPNVENSDVISQVQYVQMKIQEAELQIQREILEVTRRGAERQAKLNADLQELLDTLDTRNG